MKKIKLLLVALAVSLTSFSQTFYKVLQADYSTYTDVGGWKVQSTNIPKHIFVIVNGTAIKITNEDESLFVTYSQPIRTEYGTHYAIMWDAYDKKGIDCTIMLRVSYSDKPSCLSVIYNRISFDYTIVPNN